MRFVNWTLLRSPHRESVSEALSKLLFLAADLGFGMLSFTGGTWEQLKVVFIAGLGLSFVVKTTIVEASRYNRCDS